MRRPTKHQAEVLLRLAALSRSRRDGFVHAKDSGSPSGLEHLYDKGYADREIRRGERGGEHRYYRPTTAGWEFFEKHSLRAATRKMLTGEIDSRLITARRRGEPVLIYCGSPAYVRGVPGDVYRRESDDVLVLKVGQREIALATITEVTSEAA